VAALYPNIVRDCTHGSNSSQGWLLEGSRTVHDCMAFYTLCNSVWEWWPSPSSTPSHRTRLGTPSGCLCPYSEELGTTGCSSASGDISSRTACRAATWERVWCERSDASEFTAQMWIVRI
jgi:hypothetical protein